MALVVSVVTLLATNFARQAAVDSMQEATAERASLVRDEINGALREAAAIAAAFEAWQRAGIVDRELYKAALRRFMEQHVDYLGLFAAWEPDALDGRDAEFAGKP